MRWILDHSPLFFDFDGLLVNTEHLHFQAYKEMLKSNGIAFPWDFPTFASIAHKSSEGLRLTITDHAPALVEGKGWDILYDEKKEAYARLLESDNLELMPGVETMLQEVQMANIPHAVVTNSTRAQTEIIRKKSPFLNAIPHWITREDYDWPKPAPDAYLKAIKALGTSPAMLGFEDSLKGIRALQGAQITPVLVCSPDHPQMAEIDASIPHVYPSFQAM